MSKNGDSETPEVIGPVSPADRQKAYRIKRAIKNADIVEPADVEWLRTYEDNQKTARGASRTHKVHYTEESAEAVGTGSAAEIAAAMAAPALAKEEGRRIDSLILAAVQATNMANAATRQAYDLVFKMGAQILERNGNLEKVHLGMLESVRTSHLARTNAEAQVILKDAEIDAANTGGDDGGVDSMIQQFMPIILQELTKRGIAPKTPTK